jgi:hypothetical protein
MPRLEEFRKRRARVAAGVQTALMRHAQWCARHPDHPEAKQFFAAQEDLAKRRQSFRDAADALYALVNKGTGS